MLGCSLICWNILFWIFGNFQNQTTSLPGFKKFIIITTSSGVLWKFLPPFHIPSPFIYLHWVNCLPFTCMSAIPPSLPSYFEVLFPLLLLGFKRSPLSQYLLHTSSNKKSQCKCPPSWVEQEWYSWLDSHFHPLWSHLTSFDSHW